MSSCLVRCCLYPYLAEFITDCIGQAPQGSYALRCNGGNLDMQAMVSCREHFWGKGDDVWFAFPGGVHLCGPNNGVFISGRAKHDRLKTAQATGYQIGYGIDQIFHQCGKRGGSVSVYYEAEHDHEFIVHVGDRWV